MQNDHRDELEPRQPDEVEPQADDMRPDRESWGEQPAMAEQPPEAEEPPMAEQPPMTEPPEMAEQPASEASGAWAEQPVEHETTPPEAHAADDAEETAAREEFETASWPEQDHPHPPPSEVEAYPQAAEAPPSADAAAVPAHSVPATEPGESTKCPRCGTENRPGISFCSNCGQRLVAAGAPATVARPAPPEGTQACPRCGTHNRAGVAFCQNCGANLRAAAEGYVPPAVEPAAAMADTAEAGGRALLGPVVLVIGGIGLAVGWLLPFMGDASLFDRSFGRADGYGIAFWSAYNALPTLAEQTYFGFAAPVPILIGLLALLAIGGFLRPAPALLQLIGLLIALVWAIGLVVLFVLVEVVGGPGGDLISILRGLSPGGIIFMLASLIVVIGALTRIGRS